MASEILVITSKIKAYIRDASGFNTSAAAIEALSKQVEKLCDQAIERARGDKRKTIKDRDLDG